jgi:hypothetical protein
MQTFQMRLDDLWRVILPIIGVRRGTAFVELDNEALNVRFGWLRERIGLDELASLEAMKWPWINGVGLRIAPRRTLGLIGSTQEVVAIKFNEPRQFRVPFKMKVETLAISMESHEAFIEAVQARLETLRSIPR